MLGWGDETSKWAGPAGVAALVGGCARRGEFGSRLCPTAATFSRRGQATNEKYHHHSPCPTCYSEQEYGACRNARWLKTLLPLESALTMSLGHRWLSDNFSAEVAFH